MHALLLFTLTAGSSQLASSDASPPVGVVAPMPEVALVLQIVAVGTALGSAVALRAKRRYLDADTWAITTAWATLGLMVGVAATCLAAVL